MKALYCSHYGDYRNLKIISISKPQINDDEILVKVHYSPLTTADSLMAQGRPYFARLFLGLKRPKKGLLGTGFSGEIVDIGRQVQNFNIGDYVFGETSIDFSANAEFLKISPNAVILKSPKNIPQKELACFCDGALTSYNFLVNLAQVKINKKILIIGASGSLGSFAVSLAKHLNLNISTLTSEKNIERMKKYGAHQTYDYNQVSINDISEKFDYIYDTLGITSFFNVKNKLHKNGIYLCPVLSVHLLFSSLLSNILYKKKSIFSATGLLHPSILKEMLSKIIHIINIENIHLHIEKELPIEEAPEGYKYIQSGHKKGNIIIHF